MCGARLRRMARGASDASGARPAAGLPCSRANCDGPQIYIYTYSMYLYVSLNAMLEHNTSTIRKCETTATNYIFFNKFHINSLFFEILAISRSTKVTNKVRISYLEIFFISRIQFQY